MKRLILGLLAALALIGTEAQAACDSTVAVGQSISSAVNSAPDGAMICLRGGTHTQSPSITDGGGVNAWKRVRSFPGEVATVLGRFSIKDGARFVVLSDMRLDGSSQDLPNPQINGDDIMVLRNNITNRYNGICMSLSSSPQYGRAERIVVRRNIIHNCGDLPQANHHHGIYSSAYGVEIAYNLIIDNADRGVQLYSSGRDQRVHHNIIWGNGQGGNFSGSTSTSTFERNIIGHSIGHSGSGLAGGWNFYDWSTSSSSANVLRENCLYADNADSRYNVDGGVDHGNFSEVGNLVLASPPVGADWHTTGSCASLVGDPIDVIGEWPKGPPR